MAKRARGPAGHRTWGLASAAPDDPEPPGEHEAPRRATHRSVSGAQRPSPGREGWSIAPYHLRRLGPSSYRRRRRRVERFGRALDIHPDERRRLATTHIWISMAANSRMLLDRPWISIDLRNGASPARRSPPGRQSACQGGWALVASANRERAPRSRGSTQSVTRPTAPESVGSARAPSAGRSRGEGSLWSVSVGHHAPGLKAG